MCNDFLLWSAAETRLILQESLLELLLELGWLLVKVGVISSNNFLSSICQLSEIISFALSFTLWNSDASVFVHLVKVCYHKSSFLNFSLPAYQTYSRSDSGDTVLPNWWNFNRSKNRYGVIIIPTNQINFFDSTDSLKHPFLWFFFFSKIVAIHRGIHPQSSGQLQQLRKSSFLYLFSVPLFSSLKSF